MGRIQYPNPKFFRAKTNMDWKKQGENVREIGAIIGEMIKETDWKAVWKKTKDNLKADGKRVAEEFSAIQAMKPEERRDLLLNGEKHLGKLYRSGAANGAASGTPASILPSGSKCGGCSSAPSRRTSSPP